MQFLQFFYESQVEYLRKSFTKEKKKKKIIDLFITVLLIFIT